AHKLIIHLHKTKCMITMSIEDNGKGIPKEKMQSHKSLGLLGIHERAKQCGGKVIISSKQDEGTSIKVQIPITK
ncbi:MAG: ATP-binding protein, partial [Bacteroidales bacterium]|nr:ATP-binding protein [Bacteroidales bacterium]